MDAERGSTGSAGEPDYSARDLSEDDLEAVRIQGLIQLQLNNAISQIGPGPYQLVVLLLGGGVYMAEGSLLLMLSVIAKSLIARWKLSALFAGAMVSIIFCGLLFGTIAGGFLCDRYGRRPAILVTYGGITIFLIVSLLAPDILLLIGAKFMLGVSLGFGVPASNALVCESCPSSHRSNVYSMTMVLFSLGQMYTAVVIWFMSPNIDHDELHWRMMLSVATMLPLILWILSYFFLLESPHWLLFMQRYSEAKAVVIAMATYKGTVLPREIEEMTDIIQTPHHSEVGSPDRSLSELSEESDAKCCTMTVDEKAWNSFFDNIHLVVQGIKTDMSHLGELFSDKFYTTTVLMSYIAFVSNFAYYGMIYGLPDTLKREQQSQVHPEAHWSPAAGVFFSAVFEIPGVFLAMVLGMTVGRKVNMVITFGGTGLALGIVTYVLWKNKLANEGLVAVFLVKLFISAAFIVVYLYLLECYPTKFRATGLAFCMVVGRLGAFACPFLYDGFIMGGLHYVWFFVCMLVLVVAAAITANFLPYETKDSQLMEDSAPKKLENAPSTGEIQSLLASPHEDGNYDTVKDRRASSKRTTSKSPRLTPR
jgi:MFS family permease